MITTVRFQKRTVRVKNKYKCECGHRYYSHKSDWYTNNPFNKKTDAECAKEIIDRLSVQEKTCPKCKNSNKPILKPTNND